MTREEARDELVLWRNRNSDNGYHYKFIEALTMAIKALEQEPCETIHGSTYGGVSWGGAYKPQQLSEDVISKQAVLDYIRDNYRRWFINDDAFMQCVNGIKDITPVTPQEPKTEVLDKIRDEIEQLTITEGGDDYVRKMAELFSLKMKVLHIIDKYKAESEDKE